jgi:hypothetical protein
MNSSLNKSEIANPELDILGIDDFNLSPTIESEIVKVEDDGVAIIFILGYEFLSKRMFFPQRMTMLFEIRKPRVSSNYCF